MRSSQVQTLEVRGRPLAVRRWGDPAAPRVFMLHGWMDVSASFQFVVDALAAAWHVIAPDWRGFGLSPGNDGNPYWFPDYLADVDGLLDCFSPEEPVNLVGHSMGGNVACLYAGIRPERVRRLVSLEGFGIAAGQAEAAPERYRRWLEQLRQPPPSMATYTNVAALAERLKRLNPRLTPARAGFLAEHLAWPCAGPGESGDARVTWAGDAWHKVVNPQVYRLEEAMACWRQVTAPTLWVRGGETEFLRHCNMGEADYAARLATFTQGREVIVPNAGHMLHHDQPECVAALLEAFLCA
ncbi:MAG TPA: alpha/beta hydrolase [Azospira sp.]|nr:alpha/beta hydrolase [Azospira sp.]